LRAYIITIIPHIAASMTAMATAAANLSYHIAFPPTLIPLHRIVTAYNTLANILTISSQLHDARVKRSCMTCWHVDT